MEEILVKGLFEDSFSNKYLAEFWEGNLPETLEQILGLAIGMILEGKGKALERFQEMFSIRMLRILS